MNPAQTIAAAEGITIRAAYGRLHKAGLTPSGPARGRTYPMPDGLRGLMDAAAAAHEQHGGKLSPRPCDATGTNLKSLAMAAGVDRASVTRWLYRRQNPAPEYQPAVAAWCRRVIAAASSL